MLTILSPSKTLDLSTPNQIVKTTKPQFEKETNQLIRVLKKMKPSEIQDLMKISDKLLDEVMPMIKDFDKTYPEENSLPSIFMFKGDVYAGLEGRSLDQASLEFANDHLRILSGQYGVLRPFDLMQPYRLEMGTTLETKQGSNLYDFWGDKITRAINSDLKDLNSDVLLNLASNEYFKSLNSKKLKARVIDVDFKEERDGKLKFISVFAKKARGLMARFVMDEKIEKPEHLKAFDLDGYVYNEEGSKEDSLLFVR